MRTRIVLCLLTLLVGAGVTAAPGYAQFIQTSTPTLFEMTFNKIELSSDGGTSYTTIGGGAALTFDLASVSAGATVGNYFSGTSPLSSNTLYNRIRATISCTVRLQGCVGITCTQPGTGQQGAPPALPGNYLIPASVGCSGGEFVSTGFVGFQTDANGGLSLTVKFDATDGLALIGGTALGIGSLSMSISSP